MSRHNIHDYDNGFFICRKCGKFVTPAEGGTRHRNHCPWCLYSRHVDVCTGDRRSHCGGLMEPIGIWVREGGEFALIHRCVSCGLMRANRIAGDDSGDVLFSLAAGPLESMPFPVRPEGSDINTHGGRP